MSASDNDQHIAFIRFLMEHSTDVDAEDDYVLRTACDNCSTGVIEHLLTYESNTEDDYLLRIASGVIVTPR